MTLRLFYPRTEVELENVLRDAVRSANVLDAGVGAGREVARETLQRADDLDAANDPAAADALRVQALLGATNAAVALSMRHQPSHETNQRSIKDRVVAAVLRAAAQDTATVADALADLDAAAAQTDDGLDEYPARAEGRWIALAGAIIRERRTVRPT
jgi:hypothetical protein